MITQNKTGVLEENSISIYPNPSHGVFNLSINDNIDGSYNLTVINSIGSKVYNAAINKYGTSFQLNINISTLPPGIYYLELYNKTSKIVNKIFKE